MNIKKFIYKILIIFLALIFLDTICETNNIYAKIENNVVKDEIRYQIDDEGEKTINKEGLIVVDDTKKELTLKLKSEINIETTCTVHLKEKCDKILKYEDTAYNPETQEYTIKFTILDNQVELEGKIKLGFMYSDSAYVASETVNLKFCKYIHKPTGIKELEGQSETLEGHVELARFNYENILEKRHGLKNEDKGNTYKATCTFDSQLETSKSFKPEFQYYYINAYVEIPGIRPGWPQITVSDNSIAEVDTNNVRFEIDYSGSNSFWISFPIKFKKAQSCQVHIYTKDVKDKQNANFYINFKNIKMSEADLLQAEADRIAREEEKINEYYKKNINELKDAGEKLTFLKSIIRNDKKNNIKSDDPSSLWNTKFVNQTIPDTRKNWYRDITQLRGIGNYETEDNTQNKDSNSEAVDLLKKQIDIDDGVEGAKKEFEDSAEEAGEAVDEEVETLEERKNTALAKLEAIRNVYSMDPRATNTTKFLDVLDKTDLDKYKPDDRDADSRYVDMINTILSVISTIGIVISVIVLGVIGVKFMLGSIEEKADYKGSLIPYLVGAFLLFGICTIIKVVQGLGGSINSL